MLASVPPVGLSTLGVNPIWDSGPWPRALLAAEGCPVPGSLTTLLAGRLDSTCFDRLYFLTCSIALIYMLMCFFFLLRSLPFLHSVYSKARYPSHRSRHDQWRSSGLTVSLGLHVRGLCSPYKRSKLWSELKRLGAQVLFLQETHFTSQSTPKLPTHLFNQWFLSSSMVSKAKGTAIAIHNSCPFQAIEYFSDSWAGLFS